MSRVKQPPDVILQTKYGALSVFRFVTPYTFKYPHSIVERVRKHVDVCFIPVHEFAVEPDVVCFFYHFVSPEFVVIFKKT